MFSKCDVGQDSLEKVDFEQQVIAGCRKKQKPMKQHSLKVHKMFLNSFYVPNISVAKLGKCLLLAQFMFYS